MLTADDVRRVVEAAHHAGICNLCNHHDIAEYAGTPCRDAMCFDGKYEEFYLVPAPLFRDLAKAAGCELKQENGS